MLLAFIFTFFKNKNYLNNKIYYILLLKEQFKYLKTSHSYHLVDPSPWRAADKRDESFLTQETQLSYCECWLSKHLTRIFYLYIDDYLGLTYQHVFISTAGHTGKKSKKMFKPTLLSTLKAFIVVQFFCMGAAFFFWQYVFTEYRVQVYDILVEIFGIYEYAFRQITNINNKYWEGSRESLRKQFLRLRQTESMN